LNSLFKTPREAALEREVADLKRQLNAQREYADSVPPITAFPANEISVATVNTPTLQLAVRAGYRIADNEAYHIWAREQAFENNFNIGYYISRPALLSAYDRTQLMQFSLEKTTMQLAQMVRG
jgi:hypothetical protein